MNAPGQLAGACLALMFAASAHADDSILHFFTGAPTDGSMPQGDVTISGSTLYGMTGGGGANDYGVIYRSSADGGNYTVLQNLPTGSNPSGSLTLGGSILYGMTNGGGTGLGTVFKIQTNGGGFQMLHSFLSGGGDGRSPFGSLVLSGSTLYGMTQRGGAGNTGVIFSMNVDGTGFTVLHSFTGGSSDGSFPLGSLTLSGSTLYGMTSSGGASNGGTIFKIDIDGGGFGLLQSLSGGNPQGSLLASGSLLYGMTNSGGSGGSGTIFKIGTDGSGFDVLHNFAGGSADGGLPSGSLTMVGSTLYGTTQTGGTSDAGTVFQMNADGGGFAIVHSFAGDASDGTSPQGSLTYSDGRLFGTTSGGGPGGTGTVFSVAVVPEPGVTALCLAGGLLMLAGARRRRLRGIRVTSHSPFRRRS